jgi:glycosyltransferase involved in cell wall biosynthesis
MARAMAEAGARVNVWVDGLDRCPELRNRDVAGERDGIPYQYLVGRTRGRTSLHGLVLDRCAMAVAARRRLAGAARRQELDGLYFYTSVVKPDVERFVVRAQARASGFPVVIDLCEAPWTLRPGHALAKKLLSPLWGVDGVLCISRLLEDWVHQENLRTGSDVRLLHVPILVDVNEIAPVTVPPSGKTVLFSASPSYGETLQFLLTAMAEVWERHPDCTLVVTGGATASALGPRARGRARNIRCVGYLDRAALLREYAAASVLAAPLFDDVRSHARFPTKIAEYLATGRPVATNRVGEVPRFLEDGRSASVTPPGDVAAFATAISRMLDDPGVGSELGRRGRLVAERHFHYANHGARLCDFFSALAAARR